GARRSRRPAIRGWRPAAWATCSRASSVRSSGKVSSRSTRRFSRSSRMARRATGWRRDAVRWASSPATCSTSCPRRSRSCRRLHVRTHERVTHTPAETEALGEVLGRAARGGELIGLVGELGAGKTCFVRGLARGLGADPDRVHSPSFITVTEYAGGRLPLAHVDLYRLEAPLADPLFLRDVLYGDGVAAV